MKRLILNLCATFHSRKFFIFYKG